ncbi:MAG: polynucleotide 5'-hydroxyl-kinase [Actinobacteria bacterium]|nr:polynucleotide 5'-hydroxyl-kinase [Actinomycetota bacterium]
MRSWGEATARVLASRTALVIGQPDTGKTTFFLEVETLARSVGMAAGLVDGDLGQKTIGPPCTVGFAVSGESAITQAIYFVGDTTPAFRPIETVLGVHRLAGEARRIGCRPVVVDTSGLAGGALGARLKSAKAELLGADVAVILEREDELAVLAALLESRDIEVLRVTAPDKARKISAREREENRRKAFANYFRNAVRITMSLGDVAMLPPDGGVQDHPGLLVGLLDVSWATLAMGVILGATDRSIEILSPPHDVEKIRLIKAGALRVSPDGIELGRI